MDGKNILIVLFSFSAENKKGDGFTWENWLLNEFRNSGFDNLFCVLTEIEIPIKKDNKIILYVADVLM